MGWPAGIAIPSGDKPKHMHWTTFLQKLHHYDKLAADASNALREELVKLDSSIPNL